MRVEKSEILFESSSHRARMEHKAILLWKTMHKSKNAWSYWYSPIRASRAPSHEFGPAETVGLSPETKQV